MKNRSRSFSVLASMLCSAIVAVSCEGSETDNPVSTLPDVFDGTSPETFKPDPGGVPCVPPSIEELPNTPGRLGLPVVVSTAIGDVIATTNYAGGLQLIDNADPEHPVVLSDGAVSPNIQQLLVGASGDLWVVATEGPRVADNAIPSAAALDPQMRLIRLDVSDPRQPVRVAEADLDGEFWELRERDGEIWVLTARLSAESLACDSPLNNGLGCGYRSYDALLLRGFRVNGRLIEPVGQGEVPFDRRAWWGSDGVVTRLSDGTLHVVAWDASGALRAAQALPLGPSDIAGPADVVGHELSVVRVAQGQASLDVYDIDADAAAPVRSFPLGSTTEGIDSHSVFYAGHLWLQSGRNGRAQLWDLTGATPAPIALPQPFYAVVPIRGAVRDGQSDEQLALGWAVDATTGFESVSLLSLRGATVSLAAATDLDSTFIGPDGGTTSATSLALRGDADAVAWVLVEPSPGQPIRIVPAQPTIDLNRSLDLVVVDPDGALREGAVGVSLANVTEAALVESTSSAHPPAWSLELTRDGGTQHLEISPQIQRLVPTSTGVVGVATTTLPCEQLSANCLPGVSVYELSGQARLVANLPFPETPLPRPSNPNELSVRWELYDPLTNEQPAALELSERELAFVAEVEIECDTREECDAMEIEAVPVGEANVAFGTPAPCPPSDVDPDCVATAPATPTVFGTGQRQYFYVLQLDAPGGPAWESWGVSRLAATARRSDSFSRFGAAFATDGVLATTRLERRRSAADASDPGTTHFFLDRFERSASGDVVALPPVNVPGYAVARLGADEAMERWLSVEAAPNQTGEARLYRMNIRSDGARIERQLDLGGTFAGFRMLSSDSDARLGMVLLTPDDACGVSRLSTLRLGTSGGGADEPLELAGTLELPSSNWRIAAVDRDLAVLSRDYVYVLVRVAADGTPSVVSSRSSDVPLGGAQQLLGTHLFAAGVYSTPLKIDFSSEP